ncbi:MULTISPECIES: flavodoxin [Enterococcus]|uniref:flavodoxin n=1 Tax=Enterococcus TaxID=1350 RepID=UPI000B3E88B7|nr:MULTISPECIES: flavodoxin [Enterococcus]MBO1097489.1 flavodoxin [Enterococcus casseliflavus]MBO1144615.1 flavodoxin [Enterococcus casseliflavus]OUZ36313.1 hypothetical protein A5885_000499 [Enterococcus sp. 8E11_MSG4843]
MPAILVYSRAGENLIEGQRKKLIVGNTRVLAEKIAEKLQCPLYSLEPTYPYPESYQAMVELAKKEKAANDFPLYQEVSTAFFKERVLFIGFPNWWGTYPMILASFLKDHRLEGKIIFPFCTHEGSGFGNSIEDFKKTCPDAVVYPGLAVRGSRIEKADIAIQNWLNQHFIKIDEGVVRYGQETNSRKR